MKTILSMMLAITAYAQIDPKTYYEGLLTAPQTQATMESRQKATMDSMAVSKQIEKMTKAQVAALLPLIWKVVKADNPDNTNNSALGLYAVSLRPDSGEVLKPYIQDIAAMFSDPSPARKGTAGHLLMAMQPQVPEAADILLAFIYKPLDPKDPVAINTRIDALTALTRLQNPPKEKMEAAAMYILKQPMQDRTMTAAINAALRHGASDKMVDAIAEKLDHSSWEVRVEVIKAFRILGPEAVGKHRSQLARLANDQAQPDAVREMAKNTLDGKEEKCVAIQSGGPGGPQIVQIPGCRPN